MNWEPHLPNDLSSYAQRQGSYPNKSVPNTISHPHGSHTSQSAQGDTASPLHSPTNGIDSVPSQPESAYTGWNNRDTPWHSSGNSTLGFPKAEDHKQTVGDSDITINGTSSSSPEISTGTSKGGTNALDEQQTMQYRSGVTDHTINENGPDNQPQRTRKERNPDDYGCCDVFCGILCCECCCGD